MNTRTKELEKETTKWQRRWEESNISLQKMRENYARVQDDLVKSQENLDKMKTLCRSLHTENRDLLQELKGEQQKMGGGDAGGNGEPGLTDKEGITGLTPSAEATLADINTEADNKSKGSGVAVTATVIPDVPTPAPSSEEKVNLKVDQNQSSPKKDEKNDQNQKPSPTKPTDEVQAVTDKPAEVIPVLESPSPDKDANGNAPEVATTSTPGVPPTAPMEKLSPPESVPAAAGRSPSPVTPTPGDSSDSGSKGKKNKNKKKNKK